MNYSKRNTMIAIIEVFDSGNLGDVIAWYPYNDSFRTAQVLAAKVVNYELHEVVIIGNAMEYTPIARNFNGVYTML